MSVKIKEKMFGEFYVDTIELSRESQIYIFRLIVPWWVERTSTNLNTIRAFNDFVLPRLAADKNSMIETISLKPRVDTAVKFNVLSKKAVDLLFENIESYVMEAKLRSYGTE